jgi:hypothetical protein
VTVRCGEVEVGEKGVYGRGVVALHRSLKKYLHGVPMSSTLLLTF